MLRDSAFTAAAGTRALERSAASPQHSEARHSNGRRPERERGLYSFLTWPFYLAQVLVAQEFLAGSERARPGEPEDARAQQDARDDSGTAADPADRSLVLYATEEQAGERETANARAVLANAKTSELTGEEERNGTGPEHSQPEDAGVSVGRGAATAGGLDGSVDAQGSGTLAEQGSSRALFLPHTTDTAEVLGLLDGLESNITGSYPLLGQILNDVDLSAMLGVPDLSLGALLDGTLDLLGESATTVLGGLDLARSLDEVDASVDRALDAVGDSTTSVLDGVGSLLGIELDGAAKIVDPVLDGSGDAVAAELSAIGAEGGAEFDGATKLVGSLTGTVDGTVAVADATPPVGGHPNPSVESLIDPDTFDAIVASQASLAPSSLEAESTREDDLFSGGKYTDYGLALKTHWRGDVPRPSDQPDASTNRGESAISDNNDHASDLHAETIGATLDGLADTSIALPSVIEELGLRGGDSLL